jgi:hypothetical protein
MNMLSNTKIYGHVKTVFLCHAGPKTLDFTRANLGSELK